MDKIIPSNVMWFQKWLYLPLARKYLKFLALPLARLLCSSTIVKSPEIWKIHTSSLAILK
jgi:hypothetical protein